MLAISGARCLGSALGVLLAAGERAFAAALSSPLTRPIRTLTTSACTSCVLPTEGESCTKPEDPNGWPFAIRIEHEPDPR